MTAPTSQPSTEPTIDPRADCPAAWLLISGGTTRCTCGAAPPGRSPQIRDCRLGDVDQDVEDAA